ncbi:MAG: M28 family peptidase, partial [Bacteroidota bacterium]|nr:M28 family peptidase [Bacteroidota bacterium]
MIVRIKMAALILVLPPLFAVAQKGKKSDKLALADLEAQIRYLSDDKLEGRRTGTPGEKLASDYISIEFANAGLQPRGDKNGWLQSFEIDEGKQVDPGSYFSVNDQKLTLNKEFFPLAFSATGRVSGSPAVALQESGLPWFLDLKDLLEAEHGNPHFDLEAAIRAKAVEYVKKGATALVLYNSSRIADNLQFDPKDKREAAPIPLLYVNKEAKRKYLKDESASLDIAINVKMTEKTRMGHNVVGYLDNGALSTVIIGAHYDHLGFGEDGNTLYQGSERMVFNGADDNASGVAGTIELARWLHQSAWKGNNYLFVAFSGEELGLYGSKYFADHCPVDLKNVNYMINLDMVGRLNDSSHVLTIGGYGTSPVWEEVCNSVSDKKFFSLRFDSSGAGPSDHTSFYRKDIPVLFFFTGIHADYHKPTDDYEKINYAGELQVLKYIYDVIGSVDKRGRVAFVRTRDPQMGGARFTVTLGIMPDYTYNGDGVRADAV